MDNKISTLDLDYILDGFFSFFGFMDNPASEKTKEIMKEQSSDKIKNDIKRVNSGYRKSFVKLRKEVLHLEH
ncbi:MAG: hypothetical protein U0U67_12680 [Chitinophagales bacterium]